MIGQRGQTAIDISIQEYGTIEYISDIVQANDIELTEDLAGVYLIIPDIDFAQANQYQIVIKPIEDETTVLIAESQQSIIDLAIQEYGSIDFIGNIIRDNNVKLDQELQGLNLDINSYDLGNETVKKYFISNKIKPNNKFDEVLEITNFVYEDTVNSIFEDSNNEILE